MMYEYVKVTQIHSINRFPSRWCYPVSLLMINRDQQQFTPNYCDHFHSDSTTCCYQELVRGQEYQTELPIDFKALAKLKEEESGHEQSIDYTQQASSISSVWTTDDVSPSSFLYTHSSSNILLQWTPQSTTRMFPVCRSSSSEYASNLQMEVLIH